MFSTCQLLVTLGQNLACATFLCTHTLRTLSAPFCWQGDVSVRRWQGCRLVGRHACRMPFAFPGACPFLHSAVIWHLHWQSARFLLSALPCIFILLGLCPWFVNRLFLGRRQIRQISAVLPEVATIRSLQLFFQSPHDFLVLDIPNPLSTRDGPYGCSKFYRLVNDGSELAKFWLRPGILQQVAIHDAAHMNHSDERPSGIRFRLLAQVQIIPSFGQLPFPRLHPLVSGQHCQAHVSILDGEGTASRDHCGFVAEKNARCVTSGGTGPQQQVVKKRRQEACAAARSKQSQGADAVDAVNGLRRTEAIEWNWTPGWRRSPHGTR